MLSKLRVLLMPFESTEYFPRLPPATRIPSPGAPDLMQSVFSISLYFIWGFNQPRIKFESTVGGTTSGQV